MARSQPLPGGQATHEPRSRRRSAAANGDHLRIVERPPLSRLPKTHRPRLIGRGFLSGSQCWTATHDGSGLEPHRAPCRMVPFLAYFGPTSLFTPLRSRLCGIPRENHDSHCSDSGSLPANCRAQCGVWGLHPNRESCGPATRRASRPCTGVANFRTATRGQSPRSTPPHPP